jgi:histidyl-tRNA synthetase
VSEGLGTQTAIGGGGHYDKLMGEISGKDLPGLGFAVGFERIMLVLESLGIQIAPQKQRSVYVALADRSLRSHAFGIVQSLRDAGIAAQMDMQERSLKSQFKVAGKTDAAFVLTVGPDELAAGKLVARNMRTHEETEVSFDTVVQDVARLIG